jgi:hypothetical protein
MFLPIFLINHILNFLPIRNEKYDKVVNELKLKFENIKYYNNIIKKTSFYQDMLNNNTYYSFISKISDNEINMKVKFIDENDKNKIIKKENIDYNKINNIVFDFVITDKQFFIRNNNILFKEIKNKINGIIDLSYLELLNILFEYCYKEVKNEMDKNDVYDNLFIAYAYGRIIKDYLVFDFIFV